ncbi:MAG: eukaryotic-like serine/threonine-protein kinase [Thermoleophilaceae bacterium]|nr:eukaryotic-like serine/threonine-protein kinase [Thermoleophilaceae bacterium]
MAEVAPDTIVDGRYRVLSRLGSGGMADVYCAEDTHLGRQVALKILYRRFAQDAEFVERFKREAQSAAGLTHPNVVNVYDRGEHDGTYYIAMEYLPGRTLKDVIVAQGPLEQEAVVDIGIQILRAASFAHRRGVIHRDLKPHNVMLDDAGHAKVTDFGIARAGASEMTEAGSIMGTAQYLSPEQAQGHAATSQSDLYSVGIILYELLTGRLPFDGESAVSIAVQHLNDAPPPIHGERPDVSPELEAAAMRALEKDPEARWGDADEFIGALEAARGSLVTQPLGQDTAVFAPVAPTALAPADAPPPAEPVVYEYEDVEEEERKPRWPWIALGLTALLIALAALLLSGTDKVEVERVVGQSEAVAVDRLEDDGFEVEIDRQPDLARVGEVIHQDPAGGSEADEGSTVQLVVSSGPGEVTIPTVEGSPEDRAVRELSRAGCRKREDTNLCGFKVEVRQQSSDAIEEGDAIRTNPPGGTRAEVGSRVLLFVSTGPRQVEVPDVVGLARESAESTLNRAGLGFTVREEESDESPGTVIAQDPGADEIVDKGSRVELTVAKEAETVQVPNVVGFSRASAEDALRDLGLRPFVIEVETEDATEIDQVLSQDPGPRAEVEPRSEVEIVVGVAPEEPQEGDEVPPPGTGILTE